MQYSSATQAQFAAWKQPRRSRLSQRCPACLFERELDKN
ncbi:hypothetical protein CPter91_3241 [Collimonas pratensis]|uniref:Uncharacterized protein n=1 Tax=Collimonas pratensis TaxID=279113 RepID=A0A127Q7H1_9BURK|nr:hypothetical protein CPter91_3241 [Collimonas pratensis]